MKNQLKDFIIKTTLDSELNQVDRPYISEDLRGLRLYDDPLVGFADCADPIFSSFKKPFIIGPDFKEPKELMPDGKTIVSIFFPFNREIVASNIGGDLPSKEWLQSRISGQDLIHYILRETSSYIEELGYKVLIPEDHQASLWSERHIAYGAGLGTFSLNKGLITKSGIAGRFGSLISSIDLEADLRPYESFDQYCNYCGACALNCPVGAIDLKTGKDNKKCQAYLEMTKALYSPFYGCGKCQVGLPCSGKLPGGRP